eukprot:m.51649 g.51649  ORF g.51649 m.51649 type:complete len:67 (-) comp12638_c1_seq1:1173-1373(-)
MKCTLYNQQHVHSSLSFVLAFCFSALYSLCSIQIFHVHYTASGLLLIKVLLGFLPRPETRQHVWHG